MGSFDRWRQAQAVERTYPSHGTIPSRPEAHRELASYGLTPSDLRGRAVLAVGGGTGIVHALDAPERAVSIDPLVDDFAGALEGSAAELVSGAGERLPFEDGVFDVVICRNVLDHTAKPNAVVAEMRRVLADDGRLLFYVNVFEAPAPIRSMLWVVDRPHPHHFSESEVESLLRCHGFEPERREHRDPWQVEGNCRARLKTATARLLFGLRELHLHCSPQGELSDGFTVDV